MAVIFSEVQEDFFLNFINSSLFNDDFEEGDGEDTGARGERNETSDETYSETTFDISGEGREGSVRLFHCVSSSVELVGMQVWRGALLLADLLLARPGLVQGRHVLELAAGTGLTAIIAGRFFCVCITVLILLRLRHWKL